MDAEQRLHFKDNLLGSLYQSYQIDLLSLEEQAMAAGQLENGHLRPQEHHSEQCAAS